MGAHFPSVFQNQVEDIVLLFMLEKAPRKDGDGVSCSTIELPPVSRQMGFEPITPRSEVEVTVSCASGLCLLLYVLGIVGYIFFIGRNRGFVNSPPCTFLPYFCRNPSAFPVCHCSPALPVRHCLVNSGSHASPALWCACRIHRLPHARRRRR